MEKQTAMELTYSPMDHITKDNSSIMMPKTPTAHMSQNILPITEASKRIASTEADKKKERRTALKEPIIMAKRFKAT